MERLRLLNLNYVHLSGSYEHLSGRLVWLSWKGFPLKYIPTTLIMDNLVAIDFSYSNLKQVWRGTKVLCKLKYLNLSHSYFLVKTPNFTGFASLEKLLFNDCTKLIEVHQSIGCLEKLVVLDLKNCRKLQNIPQSIFKLKSLLYFNLSVSPTITRAPTETVRLLTFLRVNKCSRLESIQGLPVNLLELDVLYCESLENLSMASIPAFTTFQVCPKLVDFISSFERNVYQEPLERGQCNIVSPRNVTMWWCNYRSDGIVLRFRVPQLVGRRIKGYAICVDFFGLCDQHNCHFEVSNRTKMCNFSFTREIVVTDQSDFEDQRTWRSYKVNHEGWNSLHNHVLDGGDEVEITIRDDYLVVQKCKVCLSYEDDEKYPDSDLICFIIIRVYGVPYQDI
ncbi:disease resistance protein Roq1-like [Cornus florida]|uniref:disease resistance protein Roq1-like n=1 Tax=Cornus florida TaxID=4283 RepID=UPI00289C8ECB|nr:disease resistance protein Roq1-like [Cornus florida]